MIKNLIFDLGNVLVTFKPKDYLRRLGFSRKDISILTKLIFEDKRWNEFDRGTIEIEDYISALKKENPEYEEKFDMVFCENWVENMFRPKEDTIYFLKLYSKKYKIFILSNISKIVLEGIKKMDFFEYVTDGTYSYELGICKPEIGIYESLLKENNLNPDECMFLDDLPKNVEAAQKVGMKGLIFRDNFYEIERILDLFED